MAILKKKWGKTKPPLGARHNPSHPLSRGLVGHWLMNEKSGGFAYDCVNNITGSLAGSASWNPGLFGPALNFTGASGDSLNLGSPAKLRMETTLTVAAWICPRTSFAGNARIYSHGDVASPPFNEYAMLTAASGAIRFECTTNVTNDYTALDSNGLLPLDTWSHAAITYDGANMRIYLKGREDNSTAKTGTISTADNDSFIGGQDANVFTGLISDVRVYNRTLTAPEIAWLYAEPFADMIQIRTPLTKKPAAFKAAWAYRATQIVGGAF